MTRSYELAEYLSLTRSIRAPVHEVWPVFLDMNRWYTDYHWDWISGPAYAGIGLQEGQVLKATPLYGVGLQDPSLFYYQEQIKVTSQLEIVVKLTANDPKSMTADYGTEVRDMVAFYHWDFVDERDSTTVVIRSYSNLRTDKRPDETLLADLIVAFHGSWSRSLATLEGIVCGASAGPITPERGLNAT
jgi:hypothetical protein